MEKLLKKILGNSIATLLLSRPFNFPVVIIGISGGDRIKTEREDQLTRWAIIEEKNT